MTIIAHWQDESIFCRYQNQNINIHPGILAALADIGCTVTRSRSGWLAIVSV